MEEKILQKLEEMQKEIQHQIQYEIQHQIQLANEKLKQELRQELKEDLKKELLDYMFVFEENYGRRINIAFEEMMARNYKEDRQDESLKKLEQRTDMNSSFIYSHETRIGTLEKTQI